MNLSFTMQSKQGCVIIQTQDDNEDGTSRWSGMDFYLLF